MSEPSSRETRVYLRMKDCIDVFERGEIELGYLVREIEALKDSLEETDDRWREAFHNEWWTLEQVFAVALDRGKDPLTPENARLVEEAVGRMKDLLRQVGGDFREHNT